jgi:hypothetical protein
MASANGIKQSKTGDNLQKGRQPLTMVRTPKPADQKSSAATTDQKK